MFTTIFARESRRTAGVLLAAVLAFAGPTVLPAAGTAQRVWIRGIDLASPTGQQEFEQRLKVAVERICAGPDSRFPSHSARRSIESCRSSARESALQQLETHGIRVVRAAPRD